MQVANTLTIDMAKSHVLDNLLGYWLVSVSYMSSKVEIQFPPMSEGGSKHKGDRRISKFDSNRGRGRGIGRSHGQGHGVRGVHHSVSDRHDSSNGWFHGVE